MALLPVHMKESFQPLRATLSKPAPAHGDPVVHLQAADGPVMSGSTSPLSMSSHALSPFSNSPRHSSGVRPRPIPCLMLHLIVLMSPDGLCDMAHGAAFATPASQLAAHSESLHVTCMLSFRTLTQLAGCRWGSPSASQQHSRLHSQD